MKFGRISKRNGSGIMVNDGDRWMKAGVDPADLSGNLAVNRLNNPVVQMFPSSSFSLSKNTSFFMIGSCFARGLEIILNKKGFKVFSLSDEFSQWKAINSDVKPIGATNRYNTGSILNDFRWALDPENPFPEEAYVVYKSDQFIDLHMSAQLPPTSLDDLKTRRAIWDNVTANLKDVDVITLTLGLVEVWKDNELGIFCNTTPDGYAQRSNPGRFSFETLDFRQNLENLEEIHRLTSKFGKPGQKIIVTVSPVPLARTYTSKDIILANTYSKSVLRAVTEEFVDAHENVDYFPSYEIALNSQRDLVWSEDKRHVQGPFAHKIMDQFLSAYF